MTDASTEKNRTQGRCPRGSLRCAASISENSAVLPQHQARSLITVLWDEPVESFGRGASVGKSDRDKNDRCPSAGLIAILLLSPEERRGALHLVSCWTISCTRGAPRPRVSNGENPRFALRRHGNSPVMREFRRPQWNLRWTRPSPLPDIPEALPGSGAVLTNLSEILGGLPSVADIHFPPFQHHRPPSPGILPPFQPELPHDTCLLRRATRPATSREPLASPARDRTPSASQGKNSARRSREVPPQEQGRTQGQPPSQSLQSVPSHSGITRFPAA